MLLARRGASLDAPAGIACAIAVLIRPNLAPLAIVPLFLARRKIVFSIPVAIAGVFLAVVQSLWYGSPFRSGYGTAEELFALSNIACECIAILHVARRDGAGPVPLDIRILSLEARSHDAGAVRVCRVGDRVVSGLRRLRRLVVPALPAPGDGGAGDLCGGGTGRVDRALADGLARADPVRAAARRDRSWPVHRAIARYLQARRSTAPRVTRRRLHQ